MNTNGLQKHVVKNGMKILAIKIIIKLFQDVLIYKRTKILKALFFIFSI